jgi:CHAD domain-containing protein
MNEAFDTEDDDDFHEWRKRVKYHWYHVRLLQETSPAFMKARRTTMKQLSDCLGYDHDLAILKGFLDNTAEPILPAGEIDHVVEQIQLRQRALRHDAWQLGEKLYIEKPKALVKRLGGYWAAWKDTGQDE